MPLPSTLTSAQYEIIRGDVRQKPYVIFNPNEVVLSFEITGVYEDSDEIIYGLEYSASTGDWNNVKEGYTVLVSATSDKRDAYFTGRVRKDNNGVVASSTAIVLNPNSFDIEVGHQCWVIKDARLHPKHLWQDSSGTQFFDYDNDFHRLSPIIHGLQSAYVIYLVDGEASIDLSPSVRLSADGATGSSWSWDDDNGNTTSNQTVTLTYASDGVYWPRVTVTDSNGNSNFFTFMLAVIDRDNIGNVVTLNALPQDIDGFFDRGWNANVLLYGDVGNILDGTRVVIFHDSDFDEITSNVKFVGNVRREDNVMEVSKKLGRYRTEQIPCQGAVPQIAEMGSSIVALRDRSSPTEVGQIKNLTIWRCIDFLFSELSTVANIFSVAHDSDDETYRLKLFGMESEALYDSVKQAAFAIVHYVESAPQGELVVAPHVNYLSVSAKSNPTTVANFTMQDWGDSPDKIRMSFGKDHRDTVGRTIAYGGSYNTSTQTNVVLRGYTPARIPEFGQQRVPFNQQVFAANQNEVQAATELARRNVAHYKARNAVFRMKTTHIGAYDFIAPCGHQRYTWTIPVSRSTAERSFDTNDYWWCKSASIKYNHDDGLHTMTCEWEQEVTGDGIKTYIEEAPAIQTPGTGDTFTVDSPIITLDPLPTFEDTTPNTSQPPPENNPCPEWYWYYRFNGAGAGLGPGGSFYGDNPTGTIDSTGLLSRNDDEQSGGDLNTERLAFKLNVSDSGGNAVNITKFSWYYEISGVTGQTVKLYYSEDGSDTEPGTLLQDGTTIVDTSQVDWTGNIMAGAFFILFEWQGANIGSATARLVSIFLVGNGTKPNNQSAEIVDVATAP